MGFEPTTYGLRYRRSTTELRRQGFFQAKNCILASEDDLCSRGKTHHLSDIMGTLSLPDGEMASQRPLEPLF